MFNFKWTYGEFTTMEFVDLAEYVKENEISIPHPFRKVELQRKYLYLLALDIGTINKLVQIKQCKIDLTKLTGL